MSADTEPVLQITEHARDKVLRVRAQESDPEAVALWVEVTGVSGGSFTHQLRVAPVAEATDDHVVQHHDDLDIVFPAADADKLRGATVSIDGDPKYGAIVVVNPNQPASPAMPDLGGASLEGDVADRVQHVLENVVNPSIAAHGGRAELVGVEEPTAYLRLSGGCQGCGLAKVTLSQGIEVAITDAVPEITEIVDVTDHAAGENPYFESAKK
jgi:Fe/S biogenesis protein NfuA